MELKLNDAVHGFEVKRIREITDCGGTMYEMEHLKTGAQLIWMKRGGDNKTFAIAFKTIPENDTGVFHILEHSVLNGSDKYPVREPFVELLKSSMQTFLNALTYPDKTMYPVSSRNDKDFRNLMNVYLDAVFHPSIYSNPKIFRQEGWHYELNSADEDPVYKGVVYSEMQGAFSNVDEMIMNEASRIVFPDTCYKYVSGGDPAAIPELTYEQFLETHKRFYHPSNARIFLDGPVDLDTVLQDIDEALSVFDKAEIKADIPMQAEVPAQQRTIRYEITADEDPTERTHIAIVRLLGSYQDLEKNIAWQAMADLLAGSNESPLKKAMLDKGLAQDADIAVVDGIQQMFLIIGIRNTEEDRREEILKTLRETVTQLAEQGLNHSKVKAALNAMEFRYREPIEPAGIIFADDALKSWLYGGDPAMYLSAGGLFEQLRQKADQGYFEELLKETLLDEEHLSVVTAVPSGTLGQERAEATAQKLHALKESWGAETEACLAMNKELAEWQASADSEEALATLPKLSLSDVNPEPVPFEPEVKEIRGVPVLLYPEEASGIVYMNLYFSVAGLRLPELPALALYCSMLQDLPTKRHSVEELQELIRADLGSLAFVPTAMTAEGSYDKCHPMIYVSCSVLKHNMPKAVDLILEILQETVIEKDTVRALTAQTVEGMRMNMIAAGHSLAMLQCSAQRSAAGAASEYMTGFTAIKWTADFLEHYDEKIEDFLDEADKFSSVLFSMRRLTASISGKDNMKELERLVDGLPWLDFERCVVRYPKNEQCRCGIVIPAPVSYSATAANLNEAGCTYDGSLRVLSQMLTYGHLWNEVRVKGGAYGTGFNAGQTGIVSAYSYRDPDPADNLKAVTGIPEYIRSYDGDQEALASYIIGTIAAGEPLQSPAGKIRSADMRWFMGYDYEYRRKHRREMLETTVEQIKAWADPLEKVLENASVCVVGNEQVLKDCGIEAERIMALSEPKED